MIIYAVLAGCSVLHTGNLNINPSSCVAYFLSAMCGRITPLYTAKFADLNCWLRLDCSRGGFRSEVHPRHGKIGLPGISPSMQAVLFERNPWLACLSSWKHPSLLSGELHIVAICSSMLNNKQADATFSWSYISVYATHLHVTPPPCSSFLVFLYCFRWQSYKLGTISVLSFIH